ncbi:hypothetical protein H5410_021630 [Solanum commersonii]|uniref:Uncharacterized protein n=1 Tax=Solanum commersonii TaxID=4109 RepID=A0A9J5ZD41_SOLCO|nr:hypothetical protein H5410_021630 [Solanum commersonii]
MSRLSKVICASQNFLERFFYCLCVFLDFLIILGIYIIFGHFWAVTKRSKVLFCYSSRYSKVVGASQQKIDAFFCIVCVFLDFLVILGNLRDIRPFSGSYKKKSLVQVKFLLRCVLYCLCVFIDFSAILGIYMIFDHFQAVAKRSRVLFCYTSRYSKVIGASPKEVEAFFVIGGGQNFLRRFLYYLCVFLDFLAILGHLRNIRPFLGSYEMKQSFVLGIFILFGHFREVTKSSKVCSVIRHDILMCFLIFRLFWGIYVIFSHFRAVTKRSKLQKEVMFCYVICHDIPRSLLQVKKN